MKEKELNTYLITISEAEANNRNEEPVIEHLTTCTDLELIRSRFIKFFGYPEKSIVSIKLKTDEHEN